MDILPHRYRSLTVLIAVIVAQLGLLAYQVKTQQDVRLIRLWAVTAMTPVARLLETVRSSTTSLLNNYLVILDVRDENLRLREQLGKLKLEAQYLREELATADRAQALRVFQARTPSRMVAARIIGVGTSTDSKVVFIDQGSNSDVMKGMAVLTPDGIVGRIIAVYPRSSQAALITDSSVAIGVISQKNHVQGTLKGQGSSLCIVDYVQNEKKLEVGEWFFTSGDDRVFPKGFPVGQVSSVSQGKALQEIILEPSGMKEGLEEVLIVIEGVHQPIPEYQEDVLLAPLLPPPPSDGGESGLLSTAEETGSLDTDADRLRERYREIGEAQNHVFGEGLPGSPPPNFNLEPDGANPAATEKQGAGLVQEPAQLPQQ